ncbi:M23 family metallopeptidase [uncultured Aquimarina sp.]|uniref:M23 family metallopeptidase n=1 Tax=uncultured Aquimarina sp. TaxID=575652 RepID=UPI0026141999|nr:M23 family metallopeptidase [uncultured Aquimarina sp.]
MIILIAVVAVVAAVGVFAYPNIKDTLIPSTPDIPIPDADTDMASEIEEVLSGIEQEPAVRPQERPENLVPDSQGAVDEETEIQTDKESTEEESTEEEEPTEELADNATAANDAKEDGINDAYFAKEIFVEKGEEVAGTYDEYAFGNNKNYPENQGNKEGDAAYILENTRSILNAKKEFTTKNAILNGINKDEYSAGETISFVTYKMTPEYEKIDSAPLSSEVFIVAKTTNLDEETVTITIQEKEELLVAKDAPLPVLDIPEEEQEESKENQTHTRNEERMNGDTDSGIASESESSEITQESAATDSGTSETVTSDSSETNEESETEEEKDAEENEITEIKAIVEEGIAKKKIKLRPKSADDLKTWTEKLKGGTEDGMHTYQVQGEFSVTGDADAIATTIQNRSNNQLTDHIVKKEDIVELLVEGATYNNTTSFVFPKYKKGEQTELLWLKAHANGGEEEHNEEFLNESKDKENDDSSYFRIGGCDIIIWGNKFNCEERKRVVQMAKNLELADNDHIEGANWLMSIMALETGRTFDPSITNSLGYTGLIQFGTPAATDLGTTTDALRAMTILEQLEYVEKYFERRKSKLLTLTDIYLAVLYPNAAGNGNNPDYVVFDATSSIRSSRRGYSQNPAFFFEEGENGTNPNGKTYVWEIGRKIREFYDEGVQHKNKCDCNKSGWHDPVDNPMSTNYMQSGGGGELGKKWGLFGNSIRSGSAHTGLDLFAKTGENIYACVDGTVYNRRWHGGYGNTITIKVKDPKAFLALKRSYVLNSSDEQRSGNNWNESGDIYLLYAHLDSVNAFSFGEEVTSGQILGKTGRSGITAGTTAPHLHFEILCQYSFGVGTGYRINPGLFVPYKHYDDQSESDRQEQTDEKNNGKTKEVNGSEKLVYGNMDGFTQ